MAGKVATDCKDGNHDNDVISPFDDEADFMEALQEDAVQHMTILPSVPSENVQISAETSNISPPTGLDEDDSMSLISVASSASAIVRKRKVDKKKKRKLEEPIDLCGDDDDYPPQTNRDIEDIIDIKSLGARIVSNTNKIDEMRQKSSRLQGKISGDIKRMLAQIKSAAYALMTRVTSDSPAENVRRTCALVVYENEKLLAENSKLRIQVAKVPVSEKKGPVIRSIVPVPRESEIHLKLSTSRINDKSDSPSVNTEGKKVNDNYSFSEERVTERVTSNVIKALEDILKDTDFKTTGSAKQISESQRSLGVRPSARQSRNASANDVPPGSSRRSSPSVRFYNGQNYQSSDDDFPPLPVPRSQSKGPKGPDEQQPRNNLKKKTELITKKAGVSTHRQEINPSQGVNTRRPRALERQDVARSRSSSGVRSRSRSRSADRRDRIDRRRPPRAAVVAIGKTDDKLSYADIMRKARDEISLTQLGIDKTKVRLAKAGDILIEVYGDDKRRKADNLADKLTTLMEGIRVRRPEKKGCVRIYGFDDSISETDVINSREGECPRADVKVGTRTKNRNGLFTTTVRCPLATAIKLSKLRNIKLGWSRVSLELLSARPLRCYRCMETGHINVNCNSPNDRSGLCFRCSMYGHKASECTASYFCIVCAEKNLNSDHGIGSTRCGTGNTGAGIDSVDPPRNSFVPDRSNVGTDMSE